jgi:GNAT superfamily N-acetyltransferase
MEIKESTAQDLPAMIALLKQSLGEGLVPKSEAYFIWKHIRNPFGASKILLAWEDGKIVGLRAFMRWRWASQQESAEAVRAVDTATDPAYQGKGIFKKLTLQAVEECKQEGVALVFNSPNPISLQGYLKMGWYITGRMPIYIAPGSLAPARFAEKALTRVYNQFPVLPAIDQLPEGWQLPLAPVLLHTPIDKNYLRWRYAECPVLQYGAVIEPGQFGFIFRLKKVNRFMELRICELWTEKDEARKPAKKALRKLIRIARPAMVSCAPSPLYANDKKRPLGLLGPFKKGPVTTLRPLAKNKLNNFDQFYQWRPSIGAMELF